MALRKKTDDVLDTYAGIPVTSHDLQESTTTEERRGYRIIALTSLGGAVTATIFWLFNFPSDFGANTWWSVALVFVGLFLAYFPIAYGPVARQAKPRAAVVGQLNAERLNSFWYERGVTDHTAETVYRGSEPVEENRPHP